MSFARQKLAELDELSASNAGLGVRMIERLHNLRKDASPRRIKQSLKLREGYLALAVLHVARVDGDEHGFFKIVRILGIH